MFDLNKNVCKIVGHEWKKDPNTLTSECTRCAEKRAWSDDWNDGFLKKLGAAMAAPLKTNLDYQKLKKIIKVEKLDLGTLPIYDKDLPDQEI